jgi:hypothetical protein
MKRTRSLVKALTLASARRRAGTKKHHRAGQTPTSPTTHE